jgi:hypothetical protein
VFEWTFFQHAVWQESLRCLCQGNAPPDQILDAILLLPYRVVPPLLN